MGDDFYAINQSQLRVTLVGVGTIGISGGRGVNNTTAIIAVSTSASNMKLVCLCTTNNNYPRIDSLDFGGRPNPGTT
jgi:hypothetical protein